MNVWVAVDEDGETSIFDSMPYRDNKLGIWESDNNCFPLKDKDIKMLETFKMTWNIEPFKMDISNFKEIYNELI